MDLDKFQLFLDQVNQITSHHEEMAKLSGENFNIFKTLNLESSEVRLHSSILAELLNPQGTHGQEDMFLRLFVDQLVEAQPELKDFETSSAIVEVEKYIGSISSDNTSGGRIDILVSDGNKKKIIIENKIYAQDQDNQLGRYYDYDNNGLLFYLSLDGSKPTYISIEDLEKIKCKTISYRTHIIDWLENCRREAVSLPIIRETIVQYINLLKLLTHQTSKVKMKEEIKKLLLEKLQYIDSIELCLNVLDEVTRETKRKIILLLKERLPENLYINPTNGYPINIYWKEDAGSIYMGYRVQKNYEKDGEYDNKSPEAIKYSKILKEIHDDMRATTLNIGWYTPKPYEYNKKIELFDKKEMLKMSANKEYLNKIIEKIIRKEDEIRVEFEKRIKNIV